MNTDTTAKNPSQALGDSSRLCAFGVNFLEFRQRKMLPWDKLKEECGIFAIVSHTEAARLAYLGIYALQHRGQESAGIASSDGVRLHLQHGMGHVAFVDRPGWSTCRVIRPSGTSVTPPLEKVRSRTPSRSLSIAGGDSWRWRTTGIWSMPLSFAASSSATAPYFTRRATAKSSFT